MHWQGGFLFSPLEELIFSPQLRSRGRGSSSVPSGEGLTFSHSGWGQGFCDLMQYNFPISSSWQDGDCAGVTTSCAQDCSHTSQQAASGRLCRGSSSRPLPATRPGQARPASHTSPPERGTHSLFLRARAPGQRSFTGWSQTARVSQAEKLATGLSVAS